VRISFERRTLARQARGGRSPFLAGLAVVAAVALVGARPATAPTTGLASIEYGKPAPDFAYDVGDGPRKLSQNRGVPTLIHFWDSWCLPCTDELPLFVRALKEEPKLAIITVSDEDPGVARRYVREQGLDLPVSEDGEHKIFKLYSVHAIPVTVFVRTDGTVGYVSVGEMEWDELAGALGKLR
jgi:cytochrome c biogenesis protein CcmG/thiol:disulfide interchange protein DsbE